MVPGQWSVFKDRETFPLLFCKQQENTSNTHEHFVVSDGTGEDHGKDVHAHAVFHLHNQERGSFHCARCRELSIPYTSLKRVYANKHKPQ